MRNKKRSADEYSGARLPMLLVSTLLSLTSQAADQRHEIGATLGLLQVDIPHVITAGVALTGPGGTAQPLLQASDSVDLTGGGLSYVYTSSAALPGWLDWRQRTSAVAYRFAWQRYSGDAQARASAAPGGADVGIVPTKFGAPPAAPRGFFPGPAGLASRATTDVDIGRIEIGAQWQHAAPWLSDRSALEPHMRLGWTQYDYFIFSSDNFNPGVLAPSEFRDSRVQHVQHDIFDFTVGARLQRHWGQNDRFSVFGDAGVTLYFLKATLTSYENYVINGRPQRRFTGGGEREFSLGGELSAGGAWRIAPGWEAELAVDYRPWVPNGRINNPQSGDSSALPTFLDTDTQAQLGARLSVLYRFGRL